jgi:hypothetical protein
MVNQLRRCTYCRQASPVNRTNGLIVRYKSSQNRDISIMLHKTCAASWSRRFPKAVAIEIAPIMASV